MNDQQPIALEVIGMVFRSFRGRFGSTFVEKYRSGEHVPKGQPSEGKDTGLLEAMNVWAHELRGLSNADIQHGMNSKFKYPPSCDEFNQACCQRDYANLPHNTSFKALSAPVDRLSREEIDKRVKSIRFGTTQDENGQRLNNWIQIASDPKRYPYISRKYAFEVLSRHAPEHLSQVLVDEFTPKEQEEIE